MKSNEHTRVNVLNQPLCVDSLSTESTDRLWMDVSIWYKVLNWTNGWQEDFISFYFSRTHLNPIPLKPSLIPRQAFFPSWSPFFIETNTGLKYTYTSMYW